jgi:hypothetical protein
MKQLYIGFLILLFSNPTFSQANSDSYCDSLRSIKNCIDSLVIDKENDRLYLDRLTGDLNEIIGKDRDGSHPEMFISLYNKLDKYFNDLNAIKSGNSGECYISEINNRFRYEFSNYLLGMNALKDEIEKVRIAKYSMLPIINYKNAFFNLLRSKSQLEAALGQYVGLIDGKITARELAISMKQAKDTLGMINNDVLIVKGVSNELDTDVTTMKSGLDSSFKPYKDLSAKSMKDILDSKAGKVETASNVILNDARRNNWWRAALGGLAGGLIAGLIIGLFN